MMEPTKKELVLAAVVMLAVPLVGELVLRIAHVQYDPQLYIANRQRGWVLRAGAEGAVVGETRQYIRINSHGFRDRERGHDKPQDTLRVAVLGNSWTEALQVPLEETYCSLIERQLAACPCYLGKRVEVLNFGVSGYSTAQELLTLRQEVWRYHPDVVIVAFYSARDVANNVRAFNNAADPEQSPYFTYQGDHLVLDDSFRALPALQERQIMLQRIRGWVNEHIRLLQAVNALIRDGRARLAVAAVKQRAGQSGVTSLEHMVYAPPSRPAILEAWRVTEGVLVAMYHDAEAHGARFRVVTLANRPQVIPDRDKRLAFMQQLGVSNLSYADERIKALGVREGFAVTVLAPSLSAYAEVHHAYLNGFDWNTFGEGHWNETGHRLAAQVIAADMCECAEPKSRPAIAAATDTNIRFAKRGR